MNLHTNTRQTGAKGVVGLFLGLIFAMLATLALSGCASTGAPGPAEQRGPTLAEIRDTACPIALGVIIGLQVSPDIDAATKAKLHEIEPVIDTACAATSGLTDLRAMSDIAFPVILKLLAESDMTPEQKQTTVIAITTARLIILNYRQYQLPAPGAP